MNNSEYNEMMGMSDSEYEEALWTISVYGKEAYERFKRRYAAHYTWAEYEAGARDYE